MKKGRDQSSLTTQLSRVLYTQHKMRNFLNSTLKGHGAQLNSPLVLKETGDASLQVKYKVEIPPSPDFSSEHDTLVRETSMQAIPPACPRLWFTCVLCRQSVHSTRLHFIHNVGVARPWITTCPKCHVAIVAAQE